MQKTVLITGANRGIGLELARLHQQAGWHVLATCRNVTSAKVLTELLGTDQIIELDVRDEKAIRSLAETVSQKTASLDRLINNAGVFGPRSDFDDLSADKWLDTFHVNTIAPTQIADVLLGLISEGKADGEFGQIVNLSSRMGSVSRCRDEGSSFGPIYRSTKAALNMAMTCLASKVRDKNIGVYLMHPGWVQTDMGGEMADLDAQTSAMNLFSTMNGLQMADSGGFFNHDGERIEF